MTKETFLQVVKAWAELAEASKTRRYYLDYNRYDYDTLDPTFSKLMKALAEAELNLANYCYMRLEKNK